MDGDRALDAWLVHALGYGVKQHPTSGYWVVTLPDGSYQWGSGDEKGWGTEEAAKAQLPRFSGCWDGAGAVAEAMHQIERPGQPRYYLVLAYSGEPGGWAASFWDDIDFEPEWFDHPFDFPDSAGADTGPKAITLAAARALGWTGDDQDG